MVTPTDGKPVTKWPDRDEAFLDITRSIRRAVEGRTTKQAQPSRVSSGTESPVAIRRQGPRSSNLRLRKEFTEHDQDSFLDEAFEFIANFFENSLQEVKARNPGHETRFKCLDANKFTAAIYRDGNALSRCQIRLGGPFGKGITYSQGEGNDNSMNGMLSVEATDQELRLKPVLSAFGAGKDNLLSLEGAAEYYWEMFLQPLQHTARQRSF